jgi:transposase
MEIKSVRLDKYYSFSSCVDKFGDAKVYVIPKRMQLWEDRLSGKEL